MKYKKLVITLLLAVFLMIQVVNSEDWYRYGSDHQKSFVYDSDYRGDFATVNITESTLAPEKISDYSPLVADLDGDGIREIIIINNQEIRLFRGINYTLVDTWYDIDLTPLGQMEVVDFITGGNKELVTVVQKDNGTISFWAINWNGSDFNKTKEIDSVEESNGLNCDDIDSDGKVECVYFGYDGELYIYDEDDTSPTSGYNDGVTDDCVDCSIPAFIDWNDAGEDDIIVIWGTSGNKVKKLTNNGGESFTLSHTWTLANPVSQFAMIDLDGGQKELVITHTTPTVVSLGCSGCTVLAVYGIIDNNLKCNYSNFNKFQQSPAIYQSPGFNGLRTCYGQGGDCDGGGDSYDDIWVITQYNILLDDEIRVFNWDGTPGSTCTQIASFGLAVNLGGMAGTMLNPRGVWANLDSDSDFEFLYGGWIFDKDGSLVRQYYTDNDMATPQNSQTYFVVAEVTGDTINDIIYQNGPTENEIHVYSTQEEGCYDSDGGADYLTKGYTNYNLTNYWDYCVGNTLKEQYCFGAYGYTIDKDCTDYGSEYGCDDGRCQLLDCTSPMGNPTQYYCISGYVYYCNPPWQNYKICGLPGSNETGNCATPGEVNDTAEGICEPAVCHDTDGTNYLFKGYVNYNETTYWDYCVGDGVVEKICNNSVVSELLKDCKDYGSEYGCTDGACSLSPINCTDSDGTDYFNKGYVEDAGHVPIVNYDFCASNTTLWEYFCGVDGLDVIEKNCGFIGPLYKCYDGACILQPVNCTDSDDVNVWTKGYVTDVIAEIDYWDFCYDLVTVNEFICSGEEVDSILYQCSGPELPYLCSDGKCTIIANCTDSDGGLDYFTKGTTIISGEQFVDYCENDNNLNEYYCTEGDAGLAYLQHYCDFTCVDGVCVDISPINPMQADLDSYWYTDEEGELHFNGTKCREAGWKSMLMCAGWRYSVKQVATGASWVFSGIHILYFIIILIIIIIIGPLIVEFFKPRK